MPEIIIASTVSVVLENIAVITMWFGNWYGFYIVQKEVESDSDVDVDMTKLAISQNSKINAEQSTLKSHIIDQNVNRIGKENSTITIDNESELQPLVHAVQIV